MNLFLIRLALLAVVAHAEYSSEYQAPQDSLAVLEEIETLPSSSSQLDDSGYRYKTVRTFRARHRRDVSELASPEYLPPIEDNSVPTNEYLAPVVENESGFLANDGYRYKIVRKLRHRRDVSELSQYLPPGQESSQEILSNEYLAPVAPEDSGVLADDGYRYKTIRRLRHRRDVSELLSGQYIPPAHEVVQIPQTPIVSEAPVADIPVISNDYLAPLQQVDTPLADDGYRYKTVRRFKIRRQ